MWDIAPVVQSVDWKTKRKGTPASLEIKLISDIQFDYGWPISFKADGKDLFFGYLFKIKRGKHNNVTLTFYDQLKYLVSSTGTYVFKNFNMQQVVSAIAKDYELRVGQIEAPNIVLPEMLKEDKSPMDIIQECMDAVLVRTGRLLIFWSEYDKLRMDVPENLMIKTVLADASIISDFEWEGSIESSANVVKLVHDNKNTGRREVYLYKNDTLIKKWGKLQYFKKMDENANEAQIKQFAEMYMQLKAKPSETISLSFSVGDYDFRAGRAVYVDVKEINLKGWYVLDEVDHKISPSGHGMEVKLFVPHQGGGK